MDLRSGLRAVVTDRLDRATLDRFPGERDFLRGLGLALDERITGLVMPSEDRRRGLAAEVTVDALGVDIE